MSKVQIKEVFDLQMGKTPSRKNYAYWSDGDIDWVSIRDLGAYDRYVGGTRERITQLAVDESGIKQVPPNTLIMSFKLSLGKTAITVQPTYTNEAIMAFIDKGSYPFDMGYLFHQFSAKDWTARTNMAVMGATLNKKTLSESWIELPGDEEQRRIARLFDSACERMADAHRLLDTLDELVKSRFVEMFGELSESDYEGDIEQLSNLVEIVSGITKGRKVSADASLREVPYMAVSNVKDGYIDWTRVKTIEATDAEIDRYRLEPYDVLMTEGGDPDKLGRGALLIEPPVDCIHQNHVFRVRIKDARLKPEYFEYYLQSPRAKDYFLSCAKRTTGIATINKKQISSLPVVIPSIERQWAFIDFVQQVDKLKFETQQAIDKLQMLYDSLAQEYFTM